MTTGRSGIFWIGAAAAMGLALFAAFTVKNEYFFFAGYVVLQFVVLATAWNILGGYAGYVNFGTNAFFGVGAYTAVMLIKFANAPLALQILAAAAVGAALCFGAGLLTLRLRAYSFPSPRWRWPLFSRPWSTTGVSSAAPPACRFCARR